MFELDDDIKVSIELGSLDLYDIAERDQELGFLKYLDDNNMCVQQPRYTDSDYCGFLFCRNIDIVAHNDYVNLFLSGDRRVLYVDTFTIRRFSNAMLKEKENVTS